MKLLLCIVTSLLFTLTVFSQEWKTGSNSLYTYPNTTKIGIGISPQYHLHVDAGTYSTNQGYVAGRFTQNGNGTYFNGDLLSSLCTVGNWSIQGQGSAVSGAMTIRKSTGSSYNSHSGAGTFFTTFDDYVTNGTKIHYVGGAFGKIKGTILNSNNGIFAAIIGVDEINSDDTWAGYFDGNVGVTSTLFAEEIEVKLKDNWPDYVFTEDYNLRPLQEVNTYIQQNGHLPEIPTAKEVEENGISLGEMNAKLLQKIEELTLYVIELKKENEEQNKVIKELLNKTY